eukprot:15323952-Alexandrium_andersonii.AAC.1
MRPARRSGKPTRAGTSSPPADNVRRGHITNGGLARAARCGRAEHGGKEYLCTGADTHASRTLWARADTLEPTRMSL